MIEAIAGIKPGNTPLKPIYNSFGIKHLLVKDEVNNPTHTFKDRLAYEMLLPIIEKHKRGDKITRTTFGSISYGNTLLSMSFYCKWLNEFLGGEVVSAVGFVPDTLYKKVFGPDTSNEFLKVSQFFSLVQENCGIIQVNLEEKIYRTPDLENLARGDGFCYEKFVDVTEGLDHPAYLDIMRELVEDQMENPPDYIIVPFGAGILCNEIIDYVLDNGLKTEVIPVSSGNPETIAAMLYGPIWVDAKSLVSTGLGLTKHNAIDKKGRLRRPYLVYQVRDNEIISAMKKLSELGISAEPSGAAGFAVLPRLREISSKFDPNRHTVLVINTGNSFLNFKQKSYFQTDEA